MGCQRRFLLLGWVQHRQIQGAPNPEHHHTLGRFLRDLHSMPYTDTDGLSLSDAIALRWDRIIGEEQLEISDRLRDRLTQLLQGRDAGKRRWCHRDFDRRNWLWGDDYRSCTVIDFGQTRPDTRYVDWIHLMPQWSTDRDALDAFFDAYGVKTNDQDWGTALGVYGLHGAMSILGVIGTALIGPFDLAKRCSSG